MKKTCLFWIEKKQKYCPLAPKSTEDYCGLHLLTKDGKVIKLKCPFTQTHVVNPMEYEQHLLICPEKPKIHPCFVLDINLSIASLDTIHEQPFNKHLKLDSIQKILEIYDNVKIDVKSRILEHQGMAERILESNNGKHASQQSSLIANMSKAGLLEKQGVFIEFGCGSAELTNYIATAMPPTKYYLVDRKAMKLSLSPAFKERNSIERVIIDIKDLKIDRLIQEPVIAYSKHLCGAATDLTLNSLKNQKLLGLAVALCCHGKCTWESYSNHSFLKQHNIDQHMFRDLTRMSTWALSGSSNLNHWSGFNNEQLIAFGLKCKHILDVGRVKVLESMGLEVELIRYVQESKSLENVLLLANKKES